MELKSLVCPNCGANTTNAQNCEYCGSLLVRFVDKGIDLSKTSYTNNNNVFPVILHELERNLKLQFENPDLRVSTDIIRLRKWNGNGLIETINIISGITTWEDGTIQDFYDPSQKGFRILISFDTYTDTDVPEYQWYNARSDERLARFMQLDSFPLFTPHYCSYKDRSGKQRGSRSYAIDFGQDVEGTARLVSEILIKVEGWSLTDSFDIFTNAGDMNIMRAHLKWRKEMVGSGGCAVTLIALISSLSYAMYELVSLVL